MIYVSYEGIIGFMAHELGVEVKDVAAQGCLLLSLQKVSFFCVRSGPGLYSLP